MRTYGVKIGCNHTVSVDCINENAEKVTKFGACSWTVK